MAFDPYSHHRPKAVAALTLSWHGIPRTLRIGRAAAFSLFAILPLLAIWYLGATAYLIFHDQLLASLMARQADIQYSYEDRIAVLKTQLDRETSRALVDRQTLTTTFRDLAARGDQLVARAVTIDGLVNGLAMSGPPARRLPGTDDLGPSAPPAPVAPDDVRSLDLPAASPLRLDGAAGENHVDLSPEQQGDRLAALFATVEAKQSAQVARLRDPMIRSVGRLQTALAETGLPLSRWRIGSRSEKDVGGPFVPLPDEATSFEQNIALLQDAVLQHAKLTDIVDKVPLRRPLQGQLEVTSPFGARLDPFFGRAAMHTGVDLMQPYGGPVFATASGTVSVAGAEGGYGNMVEIDHGNGLVTRYAHLSSIEVVIGQRVSAGTIVGRVGSTGRATGPHLHYETRINGEPVDPSRFLKAGASLFPG